MRTLSLESHRVKIIPSFEAWHNKIPGDEAASPRVGLLNAIDFGTSTEKDGGQVVDAMLSDYFSTEAFI